MISETIFNWFIPPTMRQDVNYYGKSKLIIGTAFALMVASAIYSILYFALGFHWYGLAILLGSTAYFLSPLVIKFGGSNILAGNLIVLSVYGILLFLSLVSEGAETITNPWFAITAMVGALVTNRKSALFWGALSVATIITLFIMDQNGYDFRQPMATLSQLELKVMNMIVLIGLILLVLSFSFAYELVRENSIRDIKFSSQNIKKMADNLQTVFHQVGTNAEQLSTSSKELSRASDLMKKNADETTVQASQVSSVSEQVSQNIQVAATAVEEWTGSIQDMADDMEKALKMSDTAENLTEEAAQRISQLEKSGKEIGNIITIISDIAGQTNLLSLNAAIEAAKAAESGKGFAVVASAVKDLANKTTSATNDIKYKVESIQQETKAVTNSVLLVKEIIRKISILQNTTSDSTSAQNKMAQEMSFNLNETATGSSEIASTNLRVAEMAEGTSDAALETLKFSQALSEMALSLRELVENSVKYS